MKYFLFPIVYLSIALAIMQNWIFLALFLIVYFSFKYNALPLFFLAVMLDTYYGAYYEFPVLSVLAIFWYMVVEYINPRLMSQHS